jgi:hypothetical protein
MTVGAGARADRARYMRKSGPLTDRREFDAARLPQGDPPMAAMLKSTAPTSSRTHDPKSFSEHGSQPGPAEMEWANDHARASIP